ncbi:MAG TPA: type I DNA topoisomerase, partial [Planctomycetota bacterium]|nr:type I DNA topoisomerase [Planctomycetota bacterium]
INKILGPKFVVKACMGHVRDLPARVFGIDIEHDFAPTYETIRGKGKVLTDLRASTKSADIVYLAPDPDREGEAIAWHLKEALKIPNSKARRVTFNEITRRGVLEAFERPGEISMDRVNAQQARRFLDRIVGYKLSPLLWKKVGRGLSAGRVQSVAVRLIVEREREIRAFKKIEYWTLEARLSRSGGPVFSAELSKIDGKDAEVHSGDEASALVEELKTAAWTVTAVAKKQRFDSPAPPFTTSTLQQQSANRLHYSATRTMIIAQQLYEGVEIGDEGSVGLITYMRTDSFRVANEAVVAARAHIAKNFGERYLPEKPPETKKAGKSAQEAHEAIRPTEPDRTPESIKSYLSPEQFKLYRLIWRRFMASQMRPAEYRNTEAQITAGRTLFSARGRELVFDGYTKLMSPWIRGEEVRAMEKEGLDPATLLQRIKAAGLRPTPDAVDEIRRIAAAGTVDKALVEALTASKEQILPPLEEGDKLDLRELRPDQHFTEPPPRYSEASLVKALEKFGIGRPSTYAPIIQTIQDRGYVHQLDRRLHPTELGEIVTDKLVQHFDDIMNTGFTAELEKKLDLIEEGEKSWVEVLREFTDVFTGDLDKAKEDMESVKGNEPDPPVACEKCGKPMLIKWNRYGKFLACSGYPECKSTKPLQTAEAVGEKCDRCGAPMTVKSGRFGRFLACTKYPECKGTRPISRGRKRLRVPEGWSQICDKCGKTMVIRHSRRGPFIACPGYPDCKNTARIPKEWMMEAPSEGGAAPAADAEAEAPESADGEQE